MPITDIGDEERARPGRIRRALGAAIQGARRLFGTGGTRGGRIRAAGRAG